MGLNPNDDRGSPAELDDEAIAALIATGAASPDHPVWRDERFLEWLAQQAPVRSGDLASLGREVLARAYFRQLGVQRFCGRPSIVDDGDAAVPLVEDIELVGAQTPGAAPGCAVMFPAALPPGDYVAVHLTSLIAGAPPFFHIDDTILLIRGAGSLAMRAVIVVRDGQLAIVVGDGSSADEVGVVAAVWCPHQPEE